MEREIVVQEDPAESPLIITKKELAVVQGITEGLTTHEIAKHLHLSYHTVEVHRHRIMKRLQCRNMPQVITKLFRGKILV